MLTCSRELHFFMWLYVNIRHLILSNCRTFFSILFRTILLVMESLSFFFFFSMWECLNFSFLLEGTFVCSIMIAKAVIFITLHYNAVSLSYSLCWALDPCSSVITHCRLVHLNDISPTPTFHAVPGNHHSALCFYFKFIFRFHICDIIKYLGFPDVSFKHNVLKFHPCGCKRQDILSCVRIIFHCAYISHTFYLFLIEKIIPLHYCVDFDQISTWISHRFTCVPSHLNTPPISLPIPPF